MPRTWPARDLPSAPTPGQEARRRRYSCTELATLGAGVASSGVDSAHLAAGGRSAAPGEGHMERRETSCCARAHVRPSTADTSLRREVVEEEEEVHHLETMSQPSLARNTSKMPRSVDIRILM